MRVLFLGTPVFAVPSLQILIENSYEVCGVFTQPDRPAGRGNNLQPSPVKMLAETHGLPVLQPEKLNTEETRVIMESLNPDIIVTAAYGQIIPGWMLRYSKFFPVNVHASLLPKYRGAAPIARAILNGDTVAGVTTMVMEESLDAGGMLLREEIPVPIEVTTGELTALLAAIGARLLLRTLEGLRDNTLIPEPQDESLVTWAPRITKDHAAVDWKKPALAIHNQIRAMNPWPAAHTGFRDEKISLWRSLPLQSEGGAPPGTILGTVTNALSVQCGEGTILGILEAQRPGKKRINGREFASGARLQPGERLQ